MTELSPAAQAVLDAYEKSNDYYREEWGQLAAALRAVVDQVVPEFWHEEGDIYGETMQGVRQNILAIAAELESLPE